MSLTPPHRKTWEDIMSERRAPTRVATKPAAKSSYDEFAPGPEVEDTTPPAQLIEVVVSSGCSVHVADPNASPRSMGVKKVAGSRIKVEKTIAKSWLKSGIVELDDD
jgi:hypothetical protein